MRAIGTDPPTKATTGDDKADVRAVAAKHMDPSSTASAVLTTMSASRGRGEEGCTQATKICLLDKVSMVSHINMDTIEASAAKPATST